MSTKLASLLALAMLFTAIAYAEDTTPPRPQWREAPSATQQKAEPTTNTVTAIIVKSWDGETNPIWADLNADWSTYGTIPVSIDYTSLIDSDFTYADLVSSKADVVIISDAAGGLQQYSSTEFAAIAKYAKKGHPILATYATFQWSSTDNRGLAPVFGLSSTLDYTTNGIDNVFDRVKKACLLNKIPSSWTSEGYAESQVPSSGSWTGNLDKAKAVADSDDYVGVITVHTTKTYTGIYISNMPEYQTTGGYDAQLLYNAITCYVKQ